MWRANGLVHTGVWEATPGSPAPIKGETFEFCISFKASLSSHRMKASRLDTKRATVFVMKPGFTGTWRTIETVRKIYVTVMYTPSDHIL